MTITVSLWGIIKVVLLILAGVVVGGLAVFAYVARMLSGMFRR